MLALDVVVLYALTAHWTDAKQVVASDRDLY
jgi:hypothetical protein